MEILAQLEEAWNSHDGARLAALMDADSVYEDVAMGRVFDCHSINDLVSDTTQMSSDYRMTWTSTVQEGDMYAIEWEMTGTNDGPVSALNIPATGKSWRVPGASIGVIRGGKIGRHRDYWNRSTLLQQLGLGGKSPD